jgi:hypothetical protein
MPSSTSENTKEFEQVISAEKEAAATLSQTITEQNAVFIGFCNAVVSEALNAMGKLSAMDLSIANSTKKDVGEVKKNATEAIEQNGKLQASAKNDANATPTPTANATSGGSNSTANPEAAFVDAMGQTMFNAVKAQNNMYMIAQATTTQLVNTIISMTTATLATAVAKKEK